MKAQIIGRGGATIKGIQEKTGARITMPKNDSSSNVVDGDDEETVQVVLEGNTLQAGMARKAIFDIVGDRANTVNQKLRNIPAEFYPFIAGPNNSGISDLEKSFGNLRVQVPDHHSFRGPEQAPPKPVARGEPLEFRPAAQNNSISLAGEREAVQQARAEIERRVEDLRRELAAEQFQLNRGRHQFIVGEQGMPISQFMAETGCAIILPEDSDDDEITIIGPADRIEEGVDKATKLAFQMQQSNVDISRLHRNVPGGADAARQHAANVTRYLQRRREIERLQKAHNAHIITQLHQDNTVSPWELYAREATSTMRAQTEINRIVQGLPPSRMSTLNVNPFFHQHLQSHVAPKVQENYGVYVIPANDGPQEQVLLVFEGPESTQPEYHVPHTVPSAADAQAFQRGLEEARQYIQALINQQEEIKTEKVEVPQKFHARLKKFIVEEKKSQAPEDVNVRISVVGTTITLTGPAQKVDDLVEKVKAFIAQEVEDQKERGHTTTFPYQQKLNSMLIGKSGSMINQLREKFDVDIKVDDGSVTLTGPPAKAEAAKAYIQKMEKQWADETTHILKVDPKYHRQLIGKGGEQIKKLETRYKVSIHFPRTARPTKEDKEDDDSSVAAPAKKGRQQAEDEIEVKGPSRGADEARDELLSLLQYLKDTSHSATVAIQQSQVPSLIGSGGRALEELRQETGAKIDVPGAKEAKSESGLVDIEIKGTKSQVAAAKKLIEEKKAVFDDSASKSIDIEKKHHRALIGPGGSTLRQIVLDAGGSDDRRELARTVQFPRDGAENNKVRIEGRKAVVDKIVERMLEIVAENESRVTETIDVPQSQHRQLIGRGGDAKAALQAKFKVNLDIPSRDSGRTNVKITGKPEDVEAAKAHILEITKEVEGETIQIPVHLHHTVAQEGQLFRKLQREHNVKVDHAGHKTPKKQSKKQAEIQTDDDLPLITDENVGPAFKVLTIIPKEDEGDIPWVLRGEEVNVAKARDHIMKALEQAQKATHIGYLTLEDPRLNRHVIGQGGKTVNSIRKQSGCKIEVPKATDNHADIEIIGSLEGVEKARELILKAVEEGAQYSVNHSNPRRD